MDLHNVTLELSGKAFLDDTPAEQRRVARVMFGQWKPLCDRAEQVSVLLWIADGSEILEYSGEPDFRFEWGCWCGVANPDPDPPPGLSARQWRNTHRRPVKYRADAAPRSYRWLRELIAVLREIGAEITGKPIRIGATFDNGPEFAVSAFKYHRHPEIAQAHTLYPHSFVVCNATLHADRTRYAGYPEGIPESTPLGAFLGRQFACFARDLGYDYLWLSNGMGFGIETWSVTGALFDKRRFYPERAPEAAATLLRFWEELFRNCPGLTVETRGSNFSAGLEIAGDACPLQEVYRRYRVAPPVNSPWAALNYNTGVELAAWMSHVAEVPGGGFPFRFYVHDPWFNNSPWLDRYGREPWDLYLPLAIGRATADGTVETPESVSILTVDDTWGRMPDQVPREVIPHLLNALDTAPDRLAPLLWIYPFEEYSRAVTEKPSELSSIFCEEWYLGAAIQNGLPLNTVIATGRFLRLAAAHPERLDGCVLIVPVTGVTAETLAALQRATAAGAHCLCYGAEPREFPELAAWLGIEPAPALTGTFQVNCSMSADTIQTGALSTVLPVVPQFNGGGLAATARQGTTVLAEAVCGGRRRVLAVRRETGTGGVVGFVRAVIPCDSEVRPGGQLDLLGPSAAFPAERLLRWALASCGWRFHFTGFEPETLLPRVNLSRHDNAFYFSVFAPDTTAELRIATPLGAPLMMESEAVIEADTAIRQAAKSEHRQCRCFIRQRTRSVVRCKTGFAAYPGYSGRVSYAGLSDAEVRFFAPAGCEATFEAANPPEEQSWNLLYEPLLPVEWEETPWGRCAILRGISGRLDIAW